MEAIYTGAFTDRETDKFIDYADYILVGQYLPYYICDGSVTYPGASAPSGTCQAPNMFVKSTSQTDVSSHEIRLSTDADRMVSATVGGFYSTLDLAEKNDFTYLCSRQAIAFNGETGFGPNFSAENSTSDQGQWPNGVIFSNDVLRTDEQKGEIGRASCRERV